MNEALVFNFDGETCLRAVRQALVQGGLSVYQSFNLQAAAAATNLACECPHHGTGQCNCQYAVLLIYGEAPAPMVLTLHSCDNRTEAQIVYDSAPFPDPNLVEKSLAALEKVSLLMLPAL